MEVAKELPKFLSRASDGHATFLFIKNTLFGLYFLGSKASYSLVKKHSGQTWILKNGQKVSVDGTTWPCSGVKCSAYNLQGHGEHEGLAMGHEFDEGTTQIRTLRDFKPGKYLVHQVFYWAQHNSPVFFMHDYNHISDSDSSKQGFQYDRVHRRHNWVFKRNGYLSNSHSSKVWRFCSE